MEEAHMHGFVATDAGNYTNPDTGKEFFEVFGDQSLNHNTNTISSSKPHLNQRKTDKELYL